MFRVFLTVGVIQALTMAVNLTRTKVLAVMLGPNWMGVMAVIDRLVGMVGQTASLSIPFATIRFLPEAWSRRPGQFAP